MYKQKLKEEGIKAPKNNLTEKKLRTMAIVGGIVWVILAVVLTIYFKWWGLLAGLAVGLMVCGGVYLYLRHKQDEMISYYKKLGMTEEMYIKEMRKRNVPEKQLEQTRKVWRRVK